VDIGKDLCKVENFENVENKSFEDWIKELSVFIWHLAKKFEIDGKLDVEDLYQEGLILLYSVYNECLSSGDNHNLPGIFRYRLPKKFGDCQKYYLSKGRKCIAEKRYIDDLSCIDSSESKDESDGMDRCSYLPSRVYRHRDGVSEFVSHIYSLNPYTYYVCYIEFEKFCKEFVSFLECDKENSDVIELFKLLVNIENIELDCRGYKYKKESSKNISSFRLLAKNLNWSLQKTRTRMKRLRTLLAAYRRRNNYDLQRNECRTVS